MEFEIIRSRRKTIAIEITREGKIIVRAPLRLARREVTAFVDRHRDWVARKRDQAKKRGEQAWPRTFREGELFPFLGEMHRLRLVEGGAYLRRENGEFLLGADLARRAAAVFRTWYRARAREVLEDRVERLARRMGLTVRAVRITDARQRWGSCSASGTLNFPWRLVTAPPGVIDYVVVHELAHLVELNHSRLFWDCVARVLPDHRRRRRWLREHEHLLEV
ncbi:MAG TPA: SprT family zinc-dependent metalloprotease [Syntrophales bacterium]|nr:M48 family metallopeptidase [Syntrophobacterales bacterium]HNQ01791.1 SprT family zinc-dependent metalloprotease [Syntrophales bacterium]HQL89377.1 SprT family zinc-dependent metalloprotease [Syntrophales bacterium]